MVKKKVKCVFVVLVYRNTNDLISFIQSVQNVQLSFEVVVVNSFYDDDSKQKCYAIAAEHSCHILNVENKGYGFGNNRGIEYANNYFKYDFLILSNPDIVINKLEENIFDDFYNCAFGPIIKTLKNKSQNPYWAINNSFAEYFIYIGYKYNLILALYLGIGFNKIIREAMLLYFSISRKEKLKVFALHGSFIVFHHKVLETIKLPFDEEMFLFAEEAHLAHLLRRKNIKSYVTKNIKVLHKEDGSVSSIHPFIKSHLKRSILKYYEKLHPKK